MASTSKVRTAPQSTPYIEWAWAAARVVVVLVMVGGASVYMDGHSSQDLVLIALGFVFVYDLALIGLIARGRVQASFRAGFVLDHVTLLAVWWATVSTGQSEAPNDLYLIMFPILVVGVIRAGWPYGLAYSLLLVGAVGWLEWRYEPAGTYSAEQLPLRLGFMVLVAVLVAVLAYQLQQAKRVAELHSETMDAIQNSMTEGLIVVNQDDRLVFCNPAAATFCGITNFLTDKGGMTLTELGAAAVQSGQAVEFVNAVQTLGRDRAGFGTIYVGDETGQSSHYAVTSFPIEMHGETMTGLLVRDVTEQWELEQRQYRFISVAAHELRTPLTSVMGFSELLVSRKTSEEQREKWLGFINSESHRLAGVLDQILNVAKIRSGETALELTSVDLWKLVEDAVRECDPPAGKREIVVDMAHNVPLVVTDEGKVAHVLGNLLSNAVKYSPDTSTVTVAIYCDYDLRRIVVEVSDEGVGIADRDKHKLFASFSRVTRSDEELVRGAGLGLYISRRLMQSMGGDVWIKESRLGEGSTFTFVVPLDIAGDEEQAA